MKAERKEKTEKRKEEREPPLNKLRPDGIAAN
jgi:hypothetical protein